MNKIEWSVKKIPVKDLKEWSKNPRKIINSKLEDLKKSISKFGVAEPLVVNTDLTIVGGHGRRQALIALDINEVDCYVPNRDLTESELSEINVRLNKNIAGEFDLKLLDENFDMNDLIDWGFSVAELDLTMPTLEEDDSEDIEEVKSEFIIEVKFKNEMEMRDLYDDLTNKGYAVKSK